MKFKRTYRVLSAFLAVILAVSSVNMTVFASEESNVETQDTVIESEIEELLDETSDEEDAEQTQDTEPSEEILEDEEAESDADLDLEEEIENAIGEVESSVGGGTYSLTYKVNSDRKTATITGYTGIASGDLNIPSKIDGYTITAIGNRAFDVFIDYEERPTFTGELTLPNTIKSIGERAFFCCGFKGDLVIPDSVTTIGEMAFHAAEFDGNLILGNSLKTIGSSAFTNCIGLTGDLVIPSSVTTIQFGAFSQCTGFTGDLILPESVTIIEDMAFFWCDGLTGDLLIPSSVKRLGEDSFSACGFTRVENKSSKIIDLDRILPSFSYGDDLYWISEETGEVITKLGKGAAVRPVNWDSSIATIRFEMKDKKNKTYNEVGKETVKLRDEWFEESSYAYNHELAQTAACLSTVVYNEGTKYKIKALKDLGFDVHGAETYLDSAKKAGIYYEDETDWDTDLKTTGQFSPSWITHKTISVDGEEYTLLLVVVRGTSGTEWIDNFDPGLEKTHAGFERASDRVAKNITKYIKDNGLSSNKKKILITGHSRGAAVTNILGKKVDDSEVEGLEGIEEKNVYVYTFASPNVTQEKERSNAKYNNIFNIINPEDFVTKVMPARWGYGRYGITYSLPSRSLSWDLYNPSKYHFYLSRVKDIRKKYDCRETYNPYTNGMADVTEYMSIIAGEIPSVEKYYNKDLRWLAIGTSEKRSEKTNVKYNENSLFSLFTKTLGYNRSGDGFETESYGNIAIAHPLTLTINPYWGWIGEDTISFFFLHQILREDFKLAHEPSTYMAMLKAVDPQYLKKNKFYKGVRVSCPVDVLVKNSDGTIVGEVRDDEVISSSEGLALEVEGESKTVFVPGDDDYTLEMIGNDEGTMDYTVITYDPDLGEINRLVYSDLPLEINQIYTETIAQEKGIDELVLCDETGSVVEPDGFYEGDELGQLSVEVTVVGKGCASGCESVSPGDYVLLTATVPDGFNKFLGWYDKSGNLISTEEEYGVSVKESLELEARFTDKDNPDGLWVQEITNPDSEDGFFYYTGKAITPEIKVYDGATELTLNKDYTIAIKNNTNVGTATVDIKGIGNYTNAERTEFRILSRPITGDEFKADSIILPATGANQKPKPILTWEGKTVNAKLYTYEYYTLDEDRLALDSVKDAGEYVIIITGKGNLTGTRRVNLTLTDKKVVSKLNVSPINNQTYTGEEIKPELKVMNGKTPLTEGTDYTVEYKNNVNIGTATAIITGKNDYIGTKTVTFKIVGGALSKAAVTGVPASIVYNGYDIEPAGYRVSIKATKTTPEILLEENVDYKVTYSNNKQVGTATMIFTGINNYSGTIKKTFRITPYVNPVVDGKINVIVADSIEHSKGGAKPEVIVTFKKSDDETLVLTEQKDYTVSYSNNTSVNDGTNPRKVPSAIVTLKGNYKGTIRDSFVITPKNLSDVRILANDKVYQNKKNAYTTTVGLYDVDGKKLAVRTDYQNTITYTYKEETEVLCGGVSAVREAGSTVQPGDIIPADTKLIVTISANEGGNYRGSTSAEYRIVRASIGSMKASIPNQIYTGTAIEPTEEEIKVGNLIPRVDYVVVPESYNNNVKNGKASVTIQGIGNYGGTKNVTFTIAKRKILWWWK